MVRGDSPPAGAPTFMTATLKWCPLERSSFSMGACILVSRRYVFRLRANERPRRLTAVAQSFLAMASCTFCVRCTQCISGTRTIWLPSMLITHGSELQ